MQRNLLFILIDCLRADYCYGERGSAQTPVFNRLRRQGTWFNQAIAASANTTPSVGSIMTGLYPFAHGLRQRGSGYRLSPSCSTLAEVLRGHGYLTCALVSEKSLEPEGGLNRGFEVYKLRRGEDHLYSGWRESLETELVRLARQRNPWFLFLHLRELHVPRYLSKPFHRAEFGKTRYERALSSLDQEVGKILERIDLDHTLVIVLGDHGERFERSILEWAIRKAKHHVLGWPGGRGWYKLTHGYQVYDYLVRVPLLLLGRGVFPPDTLIDAQVRQIDIMPTILETLGVPMGGAVRIHGRSLLPVVKGEQVEELPALTEASGKAIPDPRDWLTAVRMPPWKYIFAAQNPSIPAELYHLRDDPRESKNLIDQHPAIAESLQWTFAEISSSDDGHPHSRSMRHIPPSPKELPSSS